MNQVTTKATSTTGSRPAALFQGYNSVMGYGLSMAVEGTSVTGGGSSSVSCSVCLSASELSESLEVDQSLSLGVAGLGSASEKSKFVETLDVTTYSVSIVVYAKHCTGTESATDFKLKSGIPVPSSNEELNGFVRGYGDSFVSALTRGGEYYAVYTFYSQTVEEQTSLTTQLKATGIYDGVSVNAELQTKFTSFLKTTTVRYSFKQNISGLANPSYPDPTAIISFALAFPSKTVNSPAIIAMETTGYENVYAIGNKFKPVTKNRDYFVGDGTVSGRIDDLLTLTQQLNQMQWIASVYSYYGGFTDQVLIDRTKQTTADINAIKAQMEAYEDDATQTFATLSLPSLGYGTPVLTYTTNTNTAQGGNGGSSFDDVTNPATYVQRKTRISALQLRSGSRVDHLYATYEYLDGSDGVVSSQTSHGGNGGSP
ncbi:MAG: hypothetical protein K2Q10_11330, partial [Rhodospirillales bacterium]|nr:hypothetical protein [Rhodospirillales bacterium]